MTKRLPWHACRSETARLSGLCVCVCLCLCIFVCVRLCLHTCEWHVQERRTEKYTFQKVDVRLCLHACEWHVQERRTGKYTCQRVDGKKFASADQMQKHEDLICGRVLALQTTRKGAPGPPFQCWRKRLSRLANLFPRIRKSAGNT